VREDYFRKSQGVPGLGTNPAMATDLRFTRSLTHLEASQRGRAAWPWVRLHGSLDRERSQFRDTKVPGELGMGLHDTDDRVESERAALELDWPRLPIGLALQAAGEVRAERAYPSDRLDPYPDPPPSDRRASGAALGLQWFAAGDRLTVHAARRWDRLEDHLRTVAIGGRVNSVVVTRELESPQLGVRVAPLPGFDLRANWARAWRAPDFLELFGNQGSVHGNPALRPELGETWDAGASWSAAGGRAALEYSHFRCDAHDLVVYVRNSQSSVRAENVSRAVVEGDELTARAAAPWGLSAAASATFQKARDAGAIPSRYGKKLPQRPERQAYGRLDWGRRGWRVGADVEYLGENYLDPYNSPNKLAAARTLVGASASAPLYVPGLRLTVEGKNLGNERASDVAGFPLPGRSFFVSLEARLDPRTSANPQP
jgi:iron complex outermembrane receptor protein